MPTLERDLIGAANGADIGFAMYKFVGCKTGACPLSANPWVAMAIWGTLGAMIAAGK